MLLIVAACTFAGLTESRKLSQRVEFLETFSQFLVTAQAKIRYSGVPVAKLVSDCSDMLPFLKRCAESLKEGQKFPQAWKNAVIGQPDTKKDEEFLLDFGRGLGITDTTGQLNHCSLFVKLTEARLKIAREDKEKKGRLYCLLGVCAGLALALILL